MRLAANILLIILLGCAPLLGAGDATTQRLIRGAMTDITPLSEFGTLYTNGFYFLKKENGRNIVEVRTLLTPHYELVMKVPVSKPEGDRPLLQMASAEVELWRLRSIDYDELGELQVKRDYPPITLTVGDWNTLVRAKGDFRAAGIKLESGLRLYNLDKYRDQLRERADVGW